MRQKQALTILMSGKNVFLTGAPGAGKTFVLQAYIDRARRAGKQVAVTASTGIAASHIGGTTIHAWSGLGIMDTLTSADLQRLGGSQKLVQRYNATDVLVIDEVSMLHGARLDMVNQLAKVVRANDAPFGGMQVVLVGDLFQLPPVSRDRSLDFVHLSQAWQELDLAVCYITEQHRQGPHDALLNLLEAMRSQTVFEDHVEMIQERLAARPDDSQVVTKLYTHNADVDSMNARQLAALSDSPRRFVWQASGAQAKREQLAKGLLVPEVLELKTGAEVMFVANNFAAGFVNGTRGTVVDFDDNLPVVLLPSGKRIHVEQHSWKLQEDDVTRAEINQLPLRLAWAITVHKSQGMSLDAAEIDLSRAFTPGMGYVALSRVRSLDGLYLQGINRAAMTLHPAIHTLDETLRSASEQLANHTEDIADEVEPEAPVFDEVLYAKLTNWRSEKARSEQIAPYMIAHNKTLEAIATRKPATVQQLHAIPGLGARKIESYGEDMLALVNAS